jgi:hypothetical protein
MSEKNEKQFDLGNSNCCLGMNFAANFCEQCKHDHFYHKACDIYLEAMTGKPPAEHIYNENGMPICTKFEQDEDMENHWADEFKDE